FGSLNMIPDVTPNGVFYLPPTGWLTSFYNPPNIKQLKKFGWHKYPVPFLIRRELVQTAELLIAVKS
ncbi:hypothetical protein LMB75_00770, partial [Limosilactobacillus reuteri]|nr:hypothetical protein [Limosilactobacillus reuteri]